MMSMPVGLAGKPAILAAGRFHAHFRLQSNMTREQYGEKFRQVQEYRTAVIAIR